MKHFYLQLGIALACVAIEVCERIGWDEVWFELKWFVRWHFVLEFKIAWDLWKRGDYNGYRRIIWRKWLKLGYTMKPRIIHQIDRLNDGRTIVINHNRWRIRIF